MQQDKESDEYFQVSDYGEKILRFIERNKMDGQHQTLALTYGNKKVTVRVEEQEESEYSETD